MKKIFCPIHQTFETIIEYVKDNPLLSCGCIKHYSNYVKREKCKSDIDKYLTIRSIKESKPIEQIRNNFIDALLLHSYTFNIL